MSQNGFHIHYTDRVTTPSAQIKRVQQYFVHECIIVIFGKQDCEINAKLLIRLLSASPTKMLLLCLAEWNARYSTPQHQYGSSARKQTDLLAHNWSYGQQLTYNLITTLYKCRYYRNYVKSDGVLIMSSTGLDTLREVRDVFGCFNDGDVIHLGVFGTP